VARCQAESTASIPRRHYTRFPVRPGCDQETYGGDICTYHQKLDDGLLADSSDSYHGERYGPRLPPDRGGRWRSIPPHVLEAAGA
jgi:hypothetical protein